MKILITGGAGFQGSHLCEKYVKEGHTVICYDNFMNGDLSNIRSLLGHRNFKLVKADIRDFDTLEKNSIGCDSIFHLAAQIHVDRSVVDPKETYDINVLGTLNTLEIARRHDVDRVIVASSSEVYGSAKSVPMNEDHPLEAPHPYGASKTAADRMCFAYSQTYSMPINIIRCFNIYGPKQKDTGYGGALSIFTKRVLSGIPPIIYGDGKQTRDYMYITDCVKAYDLVLKSKKFNGGVINFGTGQETSILDLANIIIKISKKDLKPVFVDPRPGEVDRLIADITRAKKLFGFKADYSIERGLTELINWYKHYKQEEWTKPG
ncbi:MAG: GDP-mannose 4,6-dehydratase [Candidatus Woesearchaeota archaeon]|nr:MAG: GDP-mannose 4,6-dehydratase [Candidatus Woesearchaeota archaeon]